MTLSKHRHYCYEIYVLEGELIFIDPEVHGCVMIISIPGLTEKAIYFGSTYSIPEILRHNIQIFRQ